MPLFSTAKCTAEDWHKRLCAVPDSRQLEQPLHLGAAVHEQGQSHYYHARKSQQRLSICADLSPELKLRKSAELLADNEEASRLSTYKDELLCLNDEYWNHSQLTPEGDQSFMEEPFKHAERTLTGICVHGCAKPVLDVEAATGEAIDAARKLEIHTVDGIEDIAPVPVAVAFVLGALPVTRMGSEVI